ncbi:MAG: hypothetical protein EHM33_31710 [Chloroflexi bacterium]|nr:MAG: hypothetical protein EHM33_31710 [Chloroflexota bacterium]
MMNVFQLRFVSAGLFFLLILPSGLWLRHAGKPYGFILFNLHKLIGLGVFIFLAVNIYRMNQAAPLSTLELTAWIATGLFFVATIVSGGLVSIDKSWPAVVPILHKLLPYLTVLATTISLYLLFRQR